MKKNILYYIAALTILFSSLTGFENKSSGITTLNLKCFHEGYYRSPNSMIKEVNLSVSLVDEFNTEVFSNTATLDMSGNATVNFPINNNGDYYVVITDNYQMIETWSVLYQFTIGGTTFVDLSLDAGNTYAQNIKLIDFIFIPPKVYYGIYVGDVNQDNVVDADDFNLVDNDIYNGVFGPGIVTDLDCGGSVGIEDLTIVDNNVLNGINVVKPF